MCTNISLKLYQLHVTIIQSMQYHLLTHHWEMGRGKGKMGEIVRKKSKAGHVRTLENGPAGERGPFSKYSRSWPGRRCYAGLHTLTRSWFEEARVRDYISKIDCARTRS